MSEAVRVADEVRGESSDGTAPTGTVAHRAGDLVLALLALVLLVAYLPGLDHSATTVRAVFLWSAGAAGVVALVRLVVEGDVGARWAAAFLGWALVAALVSDQVRNALFSAYDPDFGWVYLACSFGMWALGRRRGREGAPLVLAAVVLGVGLNVAVALGQVLVDGTGLLELKEGRADAFAGNSIFLGGVMAGAMALAAVLALRPSPRWWGWLVLLAAATVGVNTSGSRIALVAGGGLAVLAGLLRDRKRTLAIVGCIVVSLVLSTGLLNAAATTRAEASSTGSGGSRTAMWGYGLEGARERPVFGWGPGQFRPATAPRATLDYIRAEGSPVYFADAHNRIIETLVTTGIPGLVLLLGFAWSVGRRARGPFAWFAAAVFVTTLLQPTSLATTPLALLLLGYAGAGPEPLPGPRTSAGRALWWGASALLVAVGAFTGIRLVQADRSLSDAALTTSAPEADRAHRLFPDDPGTTEAWVSVLIRSALVSGDAQEGRAALAAARHGVEVDPPSGDAWTQLGQAEQAFGSDPEADGSAAREAYARALELAPWNGRAMMGLWSLERDAGDRAAQERWRARLCEIDACPVTG